MPNPPQAEAWQERVVFAYIDEPPFASPARNGGAVGCDVELAFTVLKAIGVQLVETRLTTFAELLPGVAQGRWTINTPLFVTPERAKLVAFSRPVWALKDGFVVRADSVSTLTSYEAIALLHATVGVVSAQVQRDTAIRAGVPTAHIRGFSKQRAAIEALLAGEIDAYASTALGNRTLVQQLGNDALRSVEVSAPETKSLEPVPVGAFSFAYANVQLRARFNEYLGHYLGSASHRKQVAAFGLSSSEIDSIVELDSLS